MKHCYACDRNLPVVNFGTNRSKPDGLCDECKSCKAKRDKKYCERNKVRIKARRHEYYLRNKEEICKKTRKVIDDNPNRRCLYARRTRLKLKREVFAHYCGSDNIKCASCPETDIHLLTIDHIDGGGAKHRRELGRAKAGGANFYRWLRKNGYPLGFQVLCMGCQFRKRRVEMTPANQTEKQKEKAAQVQKIKAECLKHYGSVCPCGESDLVLLTLDHVNDDGAKHRREINALGFSYYFYLKKNGFPNDPPLQVLCMKCQFRKRANNEQKIADGHMNIVKEKGCIYEHQECSHVRYYKNGEYIDHGRMIYETVPQVGSVINPLQDNWLVKEVRFLPGDSCMEIEVEEEELNQSNVIGIDKTIINW